MSRISIVAHGLGNGGAERVASILANELQERDNTIQYIAVYSGSVTYDLNAKVDYIYLNVDVPNRVKKYISRSIKIKELLEEFKPDVVISFVVQEMVYVMLQKKWKIVFSERTNPAIKPTHLRIITSWIYKKSYRVVFQTSGARDYFCKCVKNKGYIIANPIENQLPVWDLKNHNKDVITACRIVPEKNLEMMIKGFAKFHELFTDYRLVIYGAPKYPEVKEGLRQLVREMNIEKSVIFAGFSTNIRAEMAKAAMFLLTSNYEGLSNSMLEALCIGIPTICTDCPSGGAAMYINDGENGFLVPVNDDNELAKKMIRVLNNEQLQKTISEEAQKLRVELQVEKIVNQWIDVLNMEA